MMEMAARGFQNISDEVVKKRTGKITRQWAAILERLGAKKLGHTLTAKHLLKKYKLSPWWAQAVTVRYEYEKGLKK